LKKVGIILLTVGLLAACTRSESNGELTDYIEETRVEETFKELQDAKEMPISEALEELSFEPKQINVEKLPFDVENKAARVMKTKDNSEMIEFHLTGSNHDLVLIAENSVEFKEDPLLEYDEVNINKSRVALYGEGDQLQDVTWIEGNESYLLRLRYTGETEKLTKEEITTMVDELEKPE
jgi:hypothetical protein